MENDFNEKELKLLSNKVITMTGHLIAMRSENIKESKKTEDTLKLLVKQTYDIRGGLWICLITLWLLMVILLRKF